MRRYKLITLSRLPLYLSIDFIVNIHFTQEIFPDVMQQLMQICIVIIDVSRIRSVIVVLLQYSKRYLTIDAHRADRNIALRTGLLLDDSEDAVLEIVWADSHKI
jgi:hypothetical protein